MNATTTDATEVVARPTDIFSREELEAFSARSDLRGALLIAHCWAMIIGVWTVCVLFPHPLMIVLGMVLVGTRQLGLGVIAHDAAHFLLFNNATINDWAGQWFCNRPLLGASVIPYRKYHLQHHRFTQQENDPDLVLSAPFPTTPASLRRKFLRDLFGQTGWKQRVGAVGGFFQRRDARGLDWGKGLRRLGPNLLINAVFLAGFAAVGAGFLYILLWVLPNLTWELLVSRVRNIGEHAVVPDNDDRLRNTRTILANPLVRLMLAPYFVNSHFEHHLVVSAPCYRLPDVHKALLAKATGRGWRSGPGMRKSCAWPRGTRPEPGLTASLDHCGLLVVPDTDGVIGCADVFVIGQFISTA